MSYISNNSIVSKDEAAALKDMIFKRVKERAEALGDAVNNSYTSDVQADLMDVARSSFELKRNPFAQIINSTPAEKVEEKKQDLGVGFAERKVNPTEKQVIAKNKETTESIAKNVVEETMAVAGNELARKQSFLGALEFLNSQATISLVNRRAKSFEALA